MKKLFFTFILGCFLMNSLQLSAQSRIDSIGVVHYDINLQINDLPSQIITGHCNILVVSKMDNLPEVRLDLQGLEVDAVLWNDDSVPSTHENNILTIPVGNLNEGDTVALTVHYHGSPVSDPLWGGFYFNGDFAYNVGVGMGSVPPAVGRFWYPCIDDFNDHATYNFNITTASNHKAVCGGALVDSIVTPHGIEWQWELTDPIPTYLASVAVGNYQAYRDTFLSTTGAVPIEIYATPQRIPLVAASFVNLKRILHFYEEKFGDYRWQRVGYVGVPFNAGAMEHACNIAYPLVAIDGTLQNESLIFHEISHAWFGNLLTCAAPHEMWINEGIGSYAEAMGYEMLDTTGVAFKEAIRLIHRSVINNAHVTDGDYYAVNNVPAEATYGTHSYDKGALVTHVLRHYLGDELFSSGLTTLLNENEFGNITSLDLCNKLGVITGVDLSFFYEDWIAQPGFLHFYVDSMVHQNGNVYDVHLRQRLHHAQHVGSHVPVDVEFVSEQGERSVVRTVFTGETNVVELEIPFTPSYAVVDPYEKMSDAIIDYNVEIVNTSSINCDAAFVSIKANTLTENSNWRIEHHYAAPDLMREQNSSVSEVSSSHFWRILPADNHVTEGYLNFVYRAENEQRLDYELFNGHQKTEFVLLYRENNQQDWRVIPFTQLGGNTIGSLLTYHIAPGEYTFAIGTPLSVQENGDKRTFIAYPNPASESITIDAEMQIPEACTVEIYDILGIKLSEAKVDSLPIQFSISNLVSGKYFYRIKSKNTIVFVGSFQKIGN